MGYEYDEAVLKCFLKQQDRLFPEPVAAVSYTHLTLPTT